MMQRVIQCLTWTVFILSLAASAAASGSFAAVPGPPGAATSLQIRMVSYSGGSTGHVVVDVRNAGTKRQRFSPQGLYFVPDGDPEKAPQRLGAAGPFDVRQDDAWVTTDWLDIDPRTTARLRLQVYCLDSHRAAPDSRQTFHVARSRLPKPLQREIDEGARRVQKDAGSARPAPPAVQSHVWNTRNKQWVVIEGEGKQEQARPQQSGLPGREQRVRRHPIQQQHVR